MHFELASRVVAIPDQVSCDIAGEVAILNLRNGVYFGLNPVGATVWNLLQEPRLVDDVVQSILAEYSVDRAECEADLYRLLGELAEHGLVEKV